MVPLRTLVTSEEMLLPYPKIDARSTVLSKDREIQDASPHPLDTSHPLLLAATRGKPH